MAPSGDMLFSPAYSQTRLPRTLTKTPVNGELHRAISDLSIQLSVEAAAAPSPTTLPPISEAEQAKCECCGMSEEFTPAYIRRVRERHCGRWVCGLCAEAVKEELRKPREDGKLRKMEEALAAHMGVCARFNRVGKAQPVLGQAKAMREILRRCVSSDAATRRQHHQTGVRRGITRSSSCLPALMKEVNNKN